MRQTLHIFRKDARHCWPYIAAVVALMAANAWKECQEGRLQSAVRDSLPALVVAAWWFLAAASVHGETPTGDRQFWVTRPYSWKSLLAAKLLFLAAFVGVPVLLSDCVILLANGFDPLAAIPGLLLRQCWLAAFLVLPFLVSALTRSLGGLVLAGLAIFIAGLVVVVLASMYAVAHRVHPSSGWGVVPWVIPVLGLALAAWLYASRRSVRVLVLAVALAALFPFWGAPLYMPVSNAAVAGEDPRVRDIAIRLDPDRRVRVTGSADGGSRLFIPVVFSGWPAHMLSSGGVEGRVLDQGRWHGTGQGHLYTGSDGRDWIAIEFAGGLTAGPVDLSVSANLLVYEPQASATLRADGGWSRVPGFGTVAPRRAPNGQVYLIARTTLMGLKGGWRCRIDDGPELRLWGVPAAAPVSPVTFHLSPVHAVQVQSPDLGALPPPLVFRTERLVSTIQREVTVPRIRLADYQTQPPL